MRYRLLDEETLSQMIHFLDNIQIEAAKGKYKDDMDKINMCSYLISEIINSNEAMELDEEDNIEDVKPGDGLFIDMPSMDMDKKDWNKMLDQLDAFFAGWQRAQNKKNKRDSDKARKNFTKDASGDQKQRDKEQPPKLTSRDKFEHYYLQREVNKAMNEAKTMNEMLDDLNIQLPPEELN